MTKKDFIAIGDIFKAEFGRLHPLEDGTREVLKSLLGDFVELFQADNPHFKADRFRAYVAGECGPNGGAK